MGVAQGLSEGFELPSYLIAPNTYNYQLVSLKQLHDLLGVEYRSDVFGGEVIPFVHVSGRSF